MGTFVWHLDEARGEPDARALELFGLADAGISLDQALDTLIPAEDRPRCAAVAGPRPRSVRARARCRRTSASGVPTAASAGSR